MEYLFTVQHFRFNSHLQRYRRKSFKILVFSLKMDIKPEHV